MYKCELCRKVTPPHTPCKKIITRKVRFLHPERVRAKRSLILQKNGKKKRVWLPDMGGWGDQIVKETKMCPKCATKWEKENVTSRTT